MQSGNKFLVPKQGYCRVSLLQLPKDLCIFIARYVRSAMGKTERKKWLSGTFGGIESGANSVQMFI